jgi:hypothetical protein
MHYTSKQLKNVIDCLNRYKTLHFKQHLKFHSKTYLKWFCWKALTPYLGLWINKNRRKAQHLCLYFVPVVLCSEPFCPAVTLESRKDRNDQQHLYDKELKQSLPSSRTLTGQTPPKSRQLTLMMRLYPGEEVIMSWEPYYSPQVMTIIITFLESSRNKDWEND